MTWGKTEPAAGLSSRGPPFIGWKNNSLLFKNTSLAEASKGIRYLSSYQLVMVGAHFQPPNPIQAEIKQNSKGRKQYTAL